MSWIRKSPFGRDEDPAEFMISILAEEAAFEGFPFTDEERKLLREERPDVTPEFDCRVRCLVGKIFRRENEKGKVENLRSFSGAVEWAGDLEYPYIVQICESEAVRIFPRPFLGGWEKVKDLVKCIGCAVGVVILLSVFGLLAAYLIDLARK